MKLSELAYQDPLTGLPNRRFMDERIKAEVALVKSGCTESSLLMCDIDHFKSVNDTYGHLAGDDLLRELAALLQSSVRENSTLVRLGGEEFVILAPGTSLDEGKRFAERLRELVENHRFLICGHEVRITMSIGVAALTGSEDIRDYYNRRPCPLCSQRAGAQPGVSGSQVKGLEDRKQEAQWRPPAFSSAYCLELGIQLWILPSSLYTSLSFSTASSSRPCSVRPWAKMLSAFLRLRRRPGPTAAVFPSALPALTIIESMPRTILSLGIAELPS